MQPQGHVQLLLNKLRGLSVQASIDAPRFCISSGLPDVGSSAGDFDAEIWLEEGIPEGVLQTLKGTSSSVLFVSR
jgi:gamma-glutamyltranspeptidase/glutathione hydrolase